jgi:hypothetical protein
MAEEFKQKDRKKGGKQKHDQALIEQGDVTHNIDREAIEAERKRREDAKNKQMQALLSGGADATDSEEEHQKKK